MTAKLAAIALLIAIRLTVVPSLCANRVKQLRLTHRSPQILPQGVDTNVWFCFKVPIEPIRNFMKGKAENEQKKAAESVSSNANEFNFDLWAKRVRPQLLASLHKRGVR